jgi:hypothetical protein
MKLTYSLYASAAQGAPQRGDSLVVAPNQQR